MYVLPHGVATLETRRILQKNIIYLLSYIHIYVIVFIAMHSNAEIRLVYQW